MDGWVGGRMENIGIKDEWMNGWNRMDGWKRMDV
jgi:hypothetical protein